MEIALNIIIGLLFVLVIMIACILLNKWKYAYNCIKKRYRRLQRENAKLQNEVYRLTYNTPNITEKGKGK